jgi:hypothetical protein
MVVAFMAGEQDIADSGAPLLLSDQAPMNAIPPGSAYRSSIVRSRVCLERITPQFAVLAAAEFSRFAFPPL